MGDVFDLTTLETRAQRRAARSLSRAITHRPIGIASAAGRSGGGTIEWYYQMFGENVVVSKTEREREKPEEENDNNNNIITV